MDLFFKKEGLVKESNCNRRTWLASAGVAVALLLATSVSHADVFYVADAVQLTKITQDGVQTVLVKEPDKGFREPNSIAIDDKGNLYLCNNNTVEITKVTPHGDVGVFLSTDTKVNGVATDRFNNVYLSETLANTILKVSPNGVSTIFTDLVSRPSALVVDSVGNVYTATWENTVDKVTPGGLVTTIATLNVGYNGLALNGDGNVYASDFDHGSILKIAPDGSVTTFATGLQSPQGITFASNGDLYVLNSHNVSEITPNGVVTTFATGLLSPLGIVAQAVPEPSTMMVLGGLGIGLMRRNRRDR